MAHVNNNYTKALLRALVDFPKTIEGKSERRNSKNDIPIEIWLQLNRMQPAKGR